MFNVPPPPTHRLFYPSGIRRPDLPACIESLYRLGSALAHVWVQRKASLPTINITEFFRNVTDAVGEELLLWNAQHSPPALHMLLVKCELCLSYDVARCGTGSIVLSDLC
jgi:hypothetical protein